MQYRLRFATREDLPTIVAIYNSTVAGRMVTADTEPITVESREGWFAAHTPDKRPLWVAEAPDGEMLGWISYSSFYGRPAYNGTVEVSIYLAETRRGQGLGGELLQFAIEQMPAYQIHTLLGFIFGQNKPSLRLFERFGFAQWAHLPGVAILDGVPCDLIIMGKKY